MALTSVDNVPALKGAETLPTDYDPAKGLKAVAVAEAAEIHFARAKDATKLYEAIEMTQAL